MLTQDQRGKFKEKLLALRGELEEEIAGLNKNLDFGSETDHLEEEADETEEIGNSLGVKAVLNKRLNRVKKALEKIATGDYGVCEKCGKVIGEELLLVDPESEWCKDCKHKT